MTATVASALPDHAKGAHGNLREQNRPVGPARGTDTSGGAAAPSAEATSDLSVIIALWISLFTMDDAMASTNARS